MNLARRRGRSASSAICGALVCFCGALDPSLSWADEPSPAAPASHEQASPTLVSPEPAPSPVAPAELSANAPAKSAAALLPPNADDFSNEDPVETDQQRRLDLYGFADLTYT